MVARLIVAVAGALILAGCASNDPMDYLPAAPAYAAIDMETVRQSDGMTRLLDALQMVQPGSSDLLLTKVDRLYAAIEGGLAKDSRNAYVVITGKNGLAEDVLTELTKQGATPGKMAGRDVITSGAIGVAAVGGNGLIIFSGEKDLQKMLDVAKKKQAGAHTSAIFSKADKALDEHGIVLVADTKPILDMVGPQLAALKNMSPEAAEALPRVQTLMLTADWKDQPVLESTLGLSDPAAAEKLATAANTFLAMARMVPALSQAPAGIGKTIQDVRAEGTTEGVTMRLVIPKEQADTLLKAITSGASSFAPESASLPQPPE